MGETLLFFFEFIFCWSFAFMYELCTILYLLANITCGCCVCGVVDVIGVSVLYCLCYINHETFKNAAS